MRGWEMIFAAYFDFSYYVWWITDHRDRKKKLGTDIIYIVGNRRFPGDGF